MRLGWRLVCAGLVVTLAGCAGGSSGGGGGAATRLYASFDPGTTSPRACDALTLSATSGQPLDSVTISGLPPEMGQVGVYLETVADGVGTLYPTGPVAGGQADFMVPVSPDGSAEGGDVMLTVTNASDACPAVPFTIDPLPAAAADYATYMADTATAVQEFLDRVARVFGTDYAALSAADSPPSEGLLPIYLAVKVFDVALKSPPSLDTEADRDLVVRLLTKADALGVLQDAVAGLEQWEADHGSFKAAASPSGKPGARARSAPRLAGGGCTLVAPPDVEIPTTERLSAIMNDPGLDEIADGLDTFGTWMSGISSVLGVAGLSGPTDVLGALATTTGTVVDYARAAIPSAFTRLSFDAETPIWEDKSPLESAWSNAQAYVTSTPFNVTRAIADNLVALAGMSPIGGWTITVVTFSYEDEVNQVLDDVSDPEGDLCVQVPAREWGPFDVTADAWTRSEVRGDTITKKTHNTYLPARLGASDIRVDVRPEKFGQATIAEQNSVTVEAKTVSISPISPKVDKPGDPVSLTVSVNAHFPEAIEWTPPAGAGAVTHEYQGGGIHTFDFASPGSENQFPAPFRVASTSDVVPPTDFERADSVDILLNTGLEIVGARECISPGELVDLEAVLSGYSDPDNQVVTWTESAGTTTPGTPTRLASYQAPGTPGPVTVRAETPAPGVGAEPVSDEVQMLVSDTCVRQFFAAHLQSSADGDPDCDGPFTSRSDIGQEADDIDTFEDITELQIPTPPGDYFGEGSVSLITTSSFSASREVQVGGTPSCTTLQPSAQADLTIESAGSGTAHWEAGYRDSGTCSSDDTGDFCNVGQSAYVLIHTIYLPIREAGTYRLTVDLACSLFPHYGDLAVNINRYIDGTEHDLPNGPDSVPTEANPNPDPPFVPPIVSLGFECTGDTQSRSVVMDLTGPLGSTGTDLITIHYVGAPIGLTAGLTPQENLENLQAVDPLAHGPVPEFIHTMIVTTKLERLN
jgi:hypothetical protein